MKRMSALLMFGFAAIWAAALFDVGAEGGQPTRGSRDDAAPSVPAHAAPQQNAEQALPGDPAEVAATAANPSVQSQPALSSTSKSLVRKARDGVALVGKSARALLTNAQPAAAPSAKPTRSAAPAPKATGELGEGLLSPEFVEFEQRYATETRDGDWAPALEGRVHALLDSQSWADNVGLVHCQQTLCRIVIESEIVAQNPFERLLAVPGLREVTGLGPDTPYSLRSGQFSVYFSGRAPAPAL